MLSRMQNVGIAEARAGLMELTSQGVSMATTAAARLGATFSSDASYFESAMVPEKVICGQLDPSASTKDKLDAMKRILALISLGRDASHFFPFVVKNVIAKSLEVKKLVYLYLVHYAEEKQDLALLSINAFQKDLSDPNQMIRALALRVLSSIRIPVILQIVTMAIDQASRDSSPYVRKTAAHAIGKVASLAGPGATASEILYQPLELLLADRSQLVVGSAVAVLLEIAPHQVQLLHSHFRRLCRILVDLDQWSQVMVLEALLRYARTQLPGYTESDQSNDFHQTKASIDSDLGMLLTSAAPLFRCRNSAVVLAAASLYFHLTPPIVFNAIAVKPLMRLANGPPETSSVALAAILPVAIRSPDVLFVYTREFYISQADGHTVRGFKSKILSSLAVALADSTSDDSLDHDLSRLARMVVDEMAVQARPHSRSDAVIATRAISTIGTMALKGSTTLQKQCKKILVRAVKKSKTPEVVSEAVSSIRRLIQHDFDTNSSQLRDLGKVLCRGELSVPQAKGNVLWLLGEFFESLPDISMEALRVTTLNFSKEDPIVKLQLLTLAMKIGARQQTGNLLESPNKENSTAVYTRKIADHLFNLSQFDSDWDVRDRSRYLSRVQTGKAGTLGSVFKNVWKTSKPLLRSSELNSSWGSVMILDDVTVQLGSLLHVAENTQLRFKRLPPCTKNPSDPSLRTEPDAPEPVPRQTYFESGSSLGGMVPMQRVLPGFEAQPEYKPTSLKDFYSSNGEDDEEDTDAEEESYGEATDSELSDEGTVSHEHEEANTHGDQRAQKLKGSDDKNTSAGTTVSNMAADSKQDSVLDESKTQNAQLRTSLSAIDQFLGSSGQTEAKPQPLTTSGDLLAELSASVSELTELVNSVTKHKWLRAIDSWRGEGLLVEYSFSLGIDNLRSQRQLALRFVNSGKHSITNLRTSEVPSPFSSIAELTPQSSAEVSLSVDCSAGRDTRVQKRIEFDVLGTPQSRNVVIDIRPSVGDLLRPEAISLDDFSKEELRLGGMFRQEKRFTLEQVGSRTEVGLKSFSYWQENAKRIILQIANLGLIGSTVNEPLLLDIPGRFCGRFCGNDGRVVVSLTLSIGQDPGTLEATLRVGTEDMLLLANLLNYLRTNLQEAHSAT